MQQTAEVGKVLCEAMEILPSEPSDEDNENSQSNRVRLTDLLDEKANIGSSLSSMIDAMNVHRNLARFPILAFSNKPISHLANKMDLFVHKGSTQFHYQLPRTGKAKLIDSLRGP